MHDAAVCPGFDFLSDEYVELFAQSDATAFQHPLWLHHLYARLVPASGAEPFVLVVRNGDGSLVMVLPLLRRFRGPMTVLEFADLGVSDYNSPICTRATFASIVADERSCRLVRSALGRYDLLQVEKIRADGLSLGKLLGAASSEMDESAHAVPLFDPYTAWRSQFMAPALVRNIERNWRRLGRIGEIAFEVAAPAAVETVLEEMRAFREPRFRDRHGKDLLQHADYFRFYRDVAVSGTVSGFTRLYRLSLDGRTIAANFGLSHRGAFLYLLGGFDLQAHKDRSIGMLILDAILTDAAARGDVRFDLTIGDEAYKQQFGTTPTKLLAIRTQATLVGKLATMAAERLPQVHKTAKWMLAGSAPRS